MQGSQSSCSTKHKLLEKESRHGYFYEVLSLKIVSELIWELLDMLHILNLTRHRYNLFVTLPKP